MSRPDRSNTISPKLWEKKYHEVLAELQQLRAAAATGDASDGLVDEMQHQLDKPDTGYYRFGKSLNGHYWVRYKWTSGRYKGRYAIGGHDDLASAILCCQEDVERCESGKKLPPLDVGYRK